MIQKRTFLVLPLVLLAFACRGNDSKTVDSALNSDLSLASQAHPFTAADSVSAAEQARANSYAAAPAPAAARPVATHHVYRRSSSGVGPTSGGYYGAARSTAPTYHVQRNTGRDAAIGAAAGGVLGAVTSRNKISGGIIGAAAGGILGAVVGNNVDTHKVPNHY